MLCLAALDWWGVYNFSVLNLKILFNFYFAFLATLCIGEHKCWLDGHMYLKAVFYWLKQVKETCLQMNHLELSPL